MTTTDRGLKYSTEWMSKTIHGPVKTVYRSTQAIFCSYSESTELSSHFIHCFVLVICVFVLCFPLGEILCVQHWTASITFVLISHIETTLSIYSYWMTTVTDWIKEYSNLSGLFISFRSFPMKYTWGRWLFKSKLKEHLVA